MTEQMREPTYLVLAALAGGRQHGYGVMQDVAALSEGRVQLRAGTLYGALERLVRDGLVTQDGEQVVSGRLRRFYVLNPAGTRALAEQTSQRQATVKVAVRRLRALGVQA
ncbi:MAG: PadR family transcriptional regulator [Mycobacteriales bacterium]